MNGGINDITGFDPSVVTNALVHLQNDYNALYQAIAYRMQNEIVDGMSNKWASKKAQEDFSRYQETDNALLKSSTDTFINIFNSMNSAGRAWAAVNHGDYEDVTFSEDAKRIDITGILDNINGVQGMNIETAPEVIAKLPSIREDAATSLQNAVTAVQTCGFLDAFGAQTGSLVDSLTNIKKTVDTFVEQMTQTMNNELTTAKNEVEETKAKVAQAFAGANN